MINSQKLKGRIIELGITRPEVADAIGMSNTSLSYKLNGKREFTAREIFALSRVLQIEDDKDNYFFVSNVPETGTDV